MSLPNSGAAQQDQKLQGKITAAEIRQQGFLPLPLTVLRDHGQASQTLAGLLSVLRLDGNSTFRRQDLIAKSAGLPARTLRRHLAALESAGLVLKSPHPDVGTNVYRLAKPEAELLAGGFLPLPRFALSWAWSEKVVYAWLVYRAELSHDGATVEDSLRAIAKATGLSRRTVIAALASLAAAGLIEREHLLPGEKVRTGLLLATVHQGGAKVAAPRSGGEKVAAPRVQKWPEGGAKMAYHRRRKTKNTWSKNERMDHKCVTVEEISHLAGRIFEKAGYRGDRGGNLWKIAAALHLRLVSEHEAFDACEGAVQCGAANRPAYVYACLAAMVAKRGQDLPTLLKSVRIEPNWPTSPPATGRQRRMTPQNAPETTQGASRVSEVMRRLLAAQGLTGPSGGSR